MKRNTVRRLLRKQMELLAEKSKDIYPAGDELSQNSFAMSEISSELLKKVMSRKEDRMQTIYQNKSAICRTFGIGRQTMYRYEAGIREQMEHGRYNEYAIIDNEINVGVFADYIKYRKLLKDKNARKYVPPFNLQKALAMVVPEEE